MNYAPLRRPMAAALLATTLTFGGLAGCPAQPGPVPTNALKLELVTVATGFTAPVALAEADDGSGRLLIADQAGVVWVVLASGTVQAAPFLDLRDQLDERTSSQDERGLLGFALHPDFADNGRFYVYYNTPPSGDAPIGTATEVRLSEFTVADDDPDIADPDSERVLLRLAKPQTNHNGGALAFGPDAYLYAALGDGGGSGDTGFGHTEDIGNAQDKSNLLGSLIRIDVDNAPAGKAYGIPTNNPFADDPNAQPEIYAYGFRNPWRFSFDVTPGGAVRLFVGDVGQNLMEEVSLVERGGNYGWNRREGTLCFDPDSPTEPPDVCLGEGPDGQPLRAPIVAYRHLADDGSRFGSAVIGGYVYRGTAVSALTGTYVFGDYSAGFTSPNGKLFVATESTGGAWTFAEARVTDGGDGRLGAYVLGFGRDLAGELYVLARGTTDGSGTVYRIADAVVPAATTGS